MSGCSIHGLCLLCFTFGYCRKLKCLLVSNAEIEDCEFVRDVKAFGADLFGPNEDRREVLTDFYCRYLGRIFTGFAAMAADVECFLDMEELEILHFREWARDFFRRVPPHVKPHVRPEAWERVRVVATILRACFPEAAENWGKRASNDNDPPRSSRRRRRKGEPLSLARRKKKRAQRQRRTPPGDE